MKIIKKIGEWILFLEVISFCILNLIFNKRYALYKDRLHLILYRGTPIAIKLLKLCKEEVDTDPAVLILKVNGSLKSTIKTIQECESDKEFNQFMDMVDEDDKHYKYLGKGKAIVTLYGERENEPFRRQTIRTANKRESL